MKSDYKILNLNENASIDEIKRAYRNMAKKYHPNVNKESTAQKKFIEISQAYENLIKNNSSTEVFNHFTSWEDEILEMRRQAQGVR